MDKEPVPRQRPPTTPRSWRRPVGGVAIVSSGATPGLCRLCTSSPRRPNSRRRSRRRPGAFYCSFPWQRWASTPALGSREARTVGGETTRRCLPRPRIWRYGWMWGGRDCWSTVYIHDRGVVLGIPCCQVSRTGDRGDVSVEVSDSSVPCFLRWIPSPYITVLIHSPM